MKNADKAHEDSQARFKDPGGLPRRTFLSGVLAGTSYCLTGRVSARAGAGQVEVVAGVPREDVFAYIRRTRKQHDPTLYRQILGAANAYKEGDEAVGVAALDEASRQNARSLLANTRIGDLINHPIHEDDLFAYVESAVDREKTASIKDWTFAELRNFLLRNDGSKIRDLVAGLPSDVIGCVVKLMNNDQLIAVGRKVFNPLPGSMIGSQGYMGARIQPNSPTDHVDDIRWQVFNGWSFAVGDVVLGTNPVSSEVDSVLAIQQTLADILDTFGLADVMPHCVLAHVDVQAEVEQRNPGSTALWFQSLAGCTDANRTFDLSVAKMQAHAATRDGKYGFYFETGQGADATNGHGKGFDMVLHEARKYGFARALVRDVGRTQQKAGQALDPWVHLNDVAGFIGPEVFRSREQLVRCCLEDIVMGKLHGLTIGLDICSTLHMDVDLDDLDWCMDQIMPANPAYLMALPTKNDPMLSYLTTAFQDHVRLRSKFGFKVNDKMWEFFQQLGIIDAEGRPREHFGQPTWVYLQYRRKQGDRRPNEEIIAEGKAQIDQVRGRGVFIAEGYGDDYWELEPQLNERVRHLYEDSKRCIWSELPDDFRATIPTAVSVSTQSKNRRDYILHPPTGEKLSADSKAMMQQLAKKHADAYDVQLVLSDGLNALSLTDQGHLLPYLNRLRTELSGVGYRVAPEHIVISNGRVRAGYRIGEILYGESDKKETMPRVILHVIGERPGSGHHAFSVYITSAPVRTWGTSDQADHNITKVVSGIADTALDPQLAAVETVQILQAIE